MEKGQRVRRERRGECCQKTQYNKNTVTIRGASGNGSDSKCKKKNSAYEKANRSYCNRRISSILYCIYTPKAIRDSRGNEGRKAKGGPGTSRLKKG